MTAEIKNKGGRPKEWTKERIAQLAEKLLSWANKANAFALIQFCANQNICPTKIPDLARESEEFREALMCTKAKLASRMIESLNSKDGNCHPVFFNKYIRVNDYFLNQFMKDLEKIEVNEMEKRIVNIIDFSKCKKVADE